MPLCYVTLYNLYSYYFCTVHWADLVRLHFTSNYTLYNYYVTNKETLNLEPWMDLMSAFMDVDHIKYRKQKLKHTCLTHKNNYLSEVHLIHMYYIYIYAFSRILSKATCSAFRLHIVFYQYVCSLGIEPTTFYTANAMLYHWATGNLRLLAFYYFWCMRFGLSLE